MVAGGLNDLVDTVSGHASAGQHNGHHREHQEGHDNLHRVGDEGNHLADLHRAKVHRFAAEPDNQQAGAVHNQGHKRHHGNHCAVGEELGFHQIGIGLVEALFLKALTAEGADGHNAGQDFAADQVQAVNQRLHLLELRQGHVHQEDNQHQQLRPQPQR